MSDPAHGDTAALESGRVAAMTPQEYLGVLESLGVFSFQVEAETAVQAKVGIAECDRQQRIVRRFKKAVTRDVERIRTHREQLETAGSGVRLFGRWKLRGTITAVEKTRHRGETLKVIKPYESIDRQLDEILNQVDEIRHRLRGLMGE